MGITRCSDEKLPLRTQRVPARTHPQTTLILKEVKMSTDVSTSLVPEKISYPTSAANSEQHSLPRSIALHLLPGILIGVAFFLIAPITQRNGLPALWALGIADLLVFLPFIYGLLFYESYKRNGRLSLNGVVLYRERIPWW